MKTLLFASLLTVATITPFSMPMVQANNEVKFVCGESFDPETSKRLPTTFAWTPRGKIAVIRWETDVFANYSPERRCKEVSPRFQEAYDNNTINLLTNGIMNNQPVICTAKEYDEGCNTLLITLLPKDDSVKFLQQLRAIFNGTQETPPKHNNQRYIEIDIEEFLKTAPVEK